MRRRMTQIVSVVTAVAALAITATSGVARASAGDVGDPASTRRAYLIAAAMAASGVVLLAVTVWFWRTTRPENPVLGPLEVMGERRWRSADPISRMRSLDAARPDGAHAAGRFGQLSVRRVNAIDLKAHARGFEPGFDDLADGELHDWGHSQENRHAIPQARVDELEQLLSGLGIDPLPFVADRSNGVARPDDVTRNGDRPAALDPLLPHSEA